MSSRSLNSRVVAAAAEALARQGFVTPVDVCVGVGWLHASNVDDWRHGRVDDLEYILPVHGGRITVESRLGSGTTFLVSLPRDPRTESAQAAAAEPAEQAPSLRVPPPEASTSPAST